MKDLESIGRPGRDALRTKTEGGDAGRADDILGLLEAAEQVGKIGSWEWFPRVNTWLWSDNLYRLFGLEPGEIAPSRDFFVEQTHPDDTERLARFVRAVRLMSNPPPIELRMRHRTLGVRHMRTTIATIESDALGATRIVGCVQDVTDEHQGQQEIMAFQEVSETLADWDTLQTGLTDLLRKLGRALQFSFGVFWLPRGQALEPASVWSASTFDVSELKRVTWALRYPAGVGLPGRTWRSKRPERLEQFGADAGTRPLLAAGTAGLSGAVAFPALHSGEVIAVLEFYYREDSQQHDRFTRTMVAIGHEIGEFLSHRGGQMGTQHLTDRQLEVLLLAAAGNTTPQIAAELGLRPGTVRTHFDHLYEKLGVTDRAAAVAQGLRLGLIE